MNDSYAKQAKIMSVGALLAPLLAIAGIRFTGPQQVHAAAPAVYMPGEAAPSIELPSRPAVSRALQKATSHAQRLFESGISGTPFPLPDAQPQESDTPEDPGSVYAHPEHEYAEAPPVRLSGIMSRRDGAIAVIDSRIRKVGSEAAPGWTIERIDEANRLIVIRHRSGSRAEIQLATP